MALQVRASVSRCLLLSYRLLACNLSGLLDGGSIDLLHLITARPFRSEAQDIQYREYREDENPEDE
jgi:hypothetical protein